MGFIPQQGDWLWPRIGQMPFFNFLNLAASLLLPIELMCSAAAMTSKGKG